MTTQQKNPDMFMSMPHQCSYLPERTATTLFVDPRCALDSKGYGRFIRLGFRRSGDLVYRPHCQGCDACLPVRVPADRFTPNRSQRRVWRRNQDLGVRAHAPEYDQEHFELYRRYQETRHAGGAMDDPDPGKYLSFLASRQVETVFYEFRLADRLLGVAVADHLPDGLSAVYTFFDPEETRRALGVYAVLWQIARVRSLGLSALYLGYLIRECPKMAYKANYRPLEAYLNGHWSVLEP